MPDVDASQPSTERRRSERIQNSLPLIVRGIDLLGQPFEERTATVAFNVHGCRYASKHHLPKNTWITLELPQSPDRRNVRARVAWIQRPHSVREMFQIAVELETPANLWGLASPPESWTLAISKASAPGALAGERDPRTAARSEQAVVATPLEIFLGKLMTDMRNASPESSEAESPAPFVFTAAMDSPLLRELRGELERQATKAVEAAAAEARERIRQAEEEAEQRRASAADDFLRRWNEEFAAAQGSVHEQFSARLSATQDELLRGLAAELESHAGRTRELMADLDARSQALRLANQAAEEISSRMAQARLQMEAAEAAEAAHAKKEAAEPSADQVAAMQAAAATWRERLESEMGQAQAQWSELLQSSLDSSMRRLVEQLSEHSQEALRAAEQRMSARFAEMWQPMTQASSEARARVAEIKAALELNVEQARASLGEIEQSAGRMKEFAAQFEAASHDRLNELHRRVEGVLDAPTAEMHRRMEALVAGVSQRVAPDLESLANQAVERSVAEVESKLAPHLARVPELVRELAAREVQAEDSLRLHRERLRQMAESNQREAASHLEATLGELRGNFESARKDALGKWNEELEGAGVRASHAAAESIHRSSEWFQQEARARMQVLVEQTLANAGLMLEEKSGDAAKKFETQLQGEISLRVSEIGQQMEGLGSEMIGRTRSQLAEAAEAAAASFGQVLRSISDEEVEKFANQSGGAIQERLRELEGSADKLLQNLEVSAESSMGAFHERLASQIEAGVAEGRTALAAESAARLERYDRERGAREKAWLESLERLGSEAAEKYRERLDTLCDSWVVSSIRRLNEHGQNATESLLRSADQALRDSFSNVFNGLATMLRERSANAAGMAASPPPSRESGEGKATRNEENPEQPGM
ncbi:MAG TPA: hypothetical protein VEG64_07845 [Candidatus Sulfotelmatobacter sp.]|nr:hypothetical protein [Candidatus Sulfotelmatobacter sp.]